MKTKTNTCAQC